MKKLVGDKTGLKKNKRDSTKNRRAKNKYRSKKNDQNEKIFGPKRNLKKD